MPDHNMFFLSKNAFMSAMQISYKRVKTCYKIKNGFRDFESRFLCILLRL